MQAEGGGGARCVGAGSALDGGPGLVLRMEAEGDRRPLHRSEGGARRLLDDSGEVKGRGGGMGQALSWVGQRSNRDSPSAGVFGLPSGRPKSRGQVSRNAGAVQAAQGRMTQ